MGESSLLALAGRFEDGVQSISCFSGGTGAAGVFGYLFVLLIHDWCGLKFGWTLMIGNVVPCLYAAVFHWYLRFLEVDDYGGCTAAAVSVHMSDEETCLTTTLECTTAVGDVTANVPKDNNMLVDKHDDDDTASSCHHNPLNTTNNDSAMMTSTARPLIFEYTRLNNNTNGHEHDDAVRTSKVSDGNCSSAEEQHIILLQEDGNNDNSSNGCNISNSNSNSDFMVNAAVEMTLREQFLLVLSLWRFMAPLFTVYAAEYAMQSGTWAAIGFPVDSESARDKFYEYSGWVYQFGVLISRSSGTLYEASVHLLAGYAFLQVLLLVFFYFVASTQFWYGWALLVPCFVVGLLGGSVYVQSYTRIARDVPKELREFSLTACSMADTVGIVVADVCGLYIQSCLFRANDIPGAVVGCPV